MWDAESQEKLANFSLSQDKGVSARGVAGVSISPCQRYVACVDISNDHHVYVYNIQRNKMLLNTEGGKEKIFDVKWSKRPDDLRFATVGIREVKFWHPADITKRLSVKGTFGKNATMTNLTCVDFDEEGWAYTGGENGHIHVWNDQCQVAKSIKAHAGGVTSLVCVEGKLISGGKDRRVAIISIAGGNFKLEKFVELSSSFARSIDLLNGNLLVGLRNGSICEFKNVFDEEKPAEITLVASHHEGELWGVALVDDGKKVLTCADDNKFLLYDIESMKMERQGKVSDHKSANEKKLKAVTASSQSIYPANQQARAIAYNKKHNHIAIGSNFGKVSVRDFNDFDVKVASLKDAEEWCEAICYSPCEKFLATGSHDNSVYVYEISDDGKYTLYKKFSQHNSYVQALDWSLDSTYIRSSCGAYEKLYFNVVDKKHDSAGLSNTKDMEWASHSVKFGWDV